MPSCFFSVYVEDMTTNLTVPHVKKEGKMEKDDEFLWNEEDESGE